MSRIFAALFVVAGCTLAALAQDSGGKTTALDVKASGAKTFYVDDQAGSNQVSFSSQSTLEDFTGTCNKVTGECKVDPKRLESFAGRFAIKVADMRTGIDLRDEHLRSADWLDAAKHPEIVIEVTSVESARKADARTGEMTLVGTCSIKGKSNPIKIPVTLTYLDESPETQRRVKGDLIRLRSEFKLKLSDYGVNGPQGSDIIGLKVSDEIGLRVTVFGSTEPPPKGLEADKPVTTPGPAKPPPPKKP